MVPARLRHGTAHGFRRGCRTHAACPNNVGGRPTFADAIRAYRHEYRARRTAGAGAPVEHGTLRGYHAGCRDPRGCPGEQDGSTCSDARRVHRRSSARDRGVPPRAPVRADEAAARLATLRAEGLSGREIARRAGVGRTSVAPLLGALDRGEPPMATAATIARILLPREAPRA